MNMELYTHWISTNCTMVQLLIHHTNSEVVLREIDVYPTEEKKDDRLKANINIRTVGRINFFIGESGIGVPKLVIERKKVIADTKAILLYFGEQYCENDLYPTDKRDDIATSLDFVVNKLGDLFTEIYYLDIVSRKTTDSHKVELLNKILEEAETFLSENSFICGSDLTIADLCLSVITSTLEAVHHDLTNFPKTRLHLINCKELIRGWDECASFRVKRYEHWYRVSAEASKSGGCPYFHTPKQEDDHTHSYSSDIELYTCSLLPKSLIIQLLARSLELELTIKLVDLCHKEETEESRKEADENWIEMLNHLHFSDNEEADFPILIDNGKVVVETERILTYMLEKQQTSDVSQKLYPSESTTRDMVKTWLSNDFDELDTLVLDTYIRSFEDARTKRTLDQDKVIELKSILKRLEQNLEENDFMVGNDLTIADFAYVVLLSFIEVMDPDIFLEFTKVSFYLKTCKSLIIGWEDVCEPGLQLLQNWYTDLVNWTENGNCPYYNG